MWESAKSINHWNATKHSENLNFFVFSNSLVHFFYTTGTILILLTDQTYCTSIQMQILCLTLLSACIIVPVLSPRGFYCGFDNRFIRVYVTDCARLPHLGFTLQYTQQEKLSHKHVSQTILQVLYSHLGFFTKKNTCLFSCIYFFLKPTKANIFLFAKTFCESRHLKRI